MNEAPTSGGALPMAAQIYEVEERSSAGQLPFRLTKWHLLQYRAYRTLPWLAWSLPYEGCELLLVGPVDCVYAPIEMATSIAATSRYMTNPPRCEFVSLTPVSDPFRFIG